MKIEPSVCYIEKSLRGSLLVRVESLNLHKIKIFLLSRFSSLFLPHFPPERLGFVTSCALKCILISLSQILFF